MDQLVDNRRGRRPGADHPDQEPLHVRQSALPGRVEPLRPFISRPISLEPERPLGARLSARDGTAAKMDSLDPRIPRAGSRYTPYTLGTADVGPDAKSLRMGGYFGFYVVFNLLVFAYIVFRKRDRRAYLFAAAFLIVSVATASLPASHELRYFSFWMLMLVFANIYFVFGSYFPVRRCALCCSPPQS